MTVPPVVVFPEPTLVAVNNAADGRSHATRAPPTMGDSVKSVSDQLLSQLPAAATGDDTAAAVVVSSEPKTVHNYYLPTTAAAPPARGEAVPVLTDDDVVRGSTAVGPYGYKVSSDGSTRPAGGDLSTWILLGAESSPAPAANMATIKKVPKPVDATASSFVAQQSYETSTGGGGSTTRKKRPTTTTTTSTERTTTTTTTSNINASTERTTVASGATVESPIKLQDSKFKNKTPVVMGKIPSVTAVKDEVVPPELPPLDGNTRFGTPVVTFPHVPPRQRPSANNTKKVTEKPLTTKVTSTAVVVTKLLNNSSSSSNNSVPSATSVNVAPVSSTAATATTAVVTVGQDVVTNGDNVTATTTTTVKGVKKTHKKKKNRNKNKNKRRPAVKTSDGDAQSKIDDQSTKIGTSALGRPLSTRIYNYLAREVMPNVGVGLVGLMLTAGLAGLLLYSPLGGAAIPMVPLRRTDSRVHGNVHVPPVGPYTPPAATVETDNSQPEEQVFGQVLSGMSYGVNNNNPYGRERPDAVSKYKTTYRQPSSSSSEYATKYGSGPDASIKYSPVDDHPTGKYTTHDGTKYAVVESTKYSGSSDAANVASEFSAVDANVPSTQEKTASSASSPDALAFEQSTQDGRDRTYQNHHYDRLEFDSSDAYPRPGGGDDDRTAYEAPKYPGYVQDVPKDEGSSSVVGYDFDDKGTSVAASASDPTYSALRGAVPKFYDADAGGAEQISVNVRQTVKMEHGPRSMRMRRQTDEQNEIDAQLPAETIPETATKATEEALDGDATTNTTTDAVTSTNSTSTATTTTTIAAAATDAATPNTAGPSSGSNHQQHQDRFSFVDLLRRVAEVKLQMGIEILRTTAASFTQYVNAIQKRMAYMVRSLQKSNDRQQQQQQRRSEYRQGRTTVVEEKRRRRSTRHRIYSN